MELVEREWIDKSENGLRVDVADGDGVQIVESNENHVVYVYFSEIPKLILILQKMYDTNTIDSSSGNEGVSPKVQNK